MVICIGVDAGFWGFMALMWGRIGFMWFYTGFVRVVCFFDVLIQMSFASLSAIDCFFLMFGPRFQN